jgi:hypothetical protein
MLSVGTVQYIIGRQRISRASGCAFETPEGFTMRVSFKYFESSMRSWEKLFGEAAEFAAVALEAIQQRPPWTLFAFTLVREHACEVYPESVNLWEAMKLD